MQKRNVFAGPYLDRASHLRQDPAWFEQALADPGSRIVLVWNARNLIAGDAAPRAAYYALSEIPESARNANQLILLGQHDTVRYFAYELQSLDAPQVHEGTRFEDLRYVAALMSPEEAGILGYARALVAWRGRHRFCGTCGAPTLPTRAGHALLCTQASCRHEHFPRLDPAIIVLVSDGERALLGRQATWPVGRYSTIAGFVEPGESLEDAVVREVFEETGIVVDDIRYHSSQPWPFPSSLMLGFTAHAVTHDIVLRDQELEDARWFTRDDIARQRGGPLLPPGTSISYRLIETWAESPPEPSCR